MDEKITHLVYENWRRERARIHVVGCRHYKQNGGGSGDNDEWHYCSSYQEAEKIMAKFRFTDKKNCSHCM